MVATLSRRDELDHNLLLIAHLVCADGQIHIQEAKALQSLSKEVGSNQSTQTALDSILGKLPEAPTIHELAKNIAPGQQTEALQQLLAMACIDGYLAPVEKAFINSVAKFWNIAGEDVERLRLIAQQAQRSKSRMGGNETSAEDDLSKGAQILKGTESVLSRALIERLADVTPKLGRHVRKLQKEILLAGPEYDDAIARCAKVAQKDYRFTDAQLRKAHKTLMLLREDLQDVLDRLSSHVSQNKGGKTLEDVITRLDETRRVLDTRTIKELEGIRVVLKAKHRSLNHFSIAFMGRTKAGKSTLHATVTGEGWEGIGIGKQRTTRYNRIYEWKNIRIIDTPGIGAPGGESDEEIARSVVDESDVICYVVTDDSIQASEFEFMKVLKDRTKPLIVLLNIKKNLTGDPRRLEHFLKNPDKLFKKGENGIDGHVNRIRRYAQEHYSNSYLEVEPVMLLAAQMARQEKDKKQSSKLLEASRIQNFLNSLRMAIVDYGPIRRSQTLLGSTVYSVEEPLGWVKEQADSYHQQAELIANQRERLKQEFSEALSDVQADLKVKIQGVFSELRQSLEAFATDHWESSAEDIQKAWAVKLKQHELNQQLENLVQAAQSDLEHRTQETLEEIGTELELLSNFKTTATSFKTENQKFFEQHKEFVALGAAVLSVAACIPPLAPIAPLLLGASFVLGVFAKTLKGKAKRRSEAVSSIRSQLIEQLSSHEKQVLDQTHEQLEKCSQTIAASVDDYFRQLSDGLNKIAICLQTTGSALSEITNTLNTAYASRILLWATGKAQKVGRVQRDFGKEMNIWPASASVKDSLQRSPEKLSQILQETIVIH